MVNPAASFQIVSLNGKIWHLYVRVFLLCAGNANAPVFPGAAQGIAPAYAVSSSLAVSYANITHNDMLDLSQTVRMRSH